MSHNKSLTIFQKEKMFIKVRFSKMLMEPGEQWGSIFIAVGFFRKTGLALHQQTTDCVGLVIACYWKIAMLIVHSCSISCSLPELLRLWGGGDRGRQLASTIDCIFNGISNYLMHHLRLKLAIWTAVLISGFISVVTYCSMTCCSSVCLGMSMHFFPTQTLKTANLI